MLLCDMDISMVVWLIEMCDVIIVKYTLYSTCSSTTIESLRWPYFLCLRKSFFQKMIAIDGPSPPMNLFPFCSLVTLTSFVPPGCHIGETRSIRTPSDSKIYGNQYNRTSKNSVMGEMYLEMEDFMRQVSWRKSRQMVGQMGNSFRIIFQPNKIILW